MQIFGLRLSALLVAGTLALGCGAPVVAGADDRIPEVMLKADFEACTKNARRNAALTEEQVQSYCDCSRKRIEDRFDLNSYAAMALDLQAGRRGPGQSVLAQIVAECADRTLR